MGMTRGKLRGLFFSALIALYSLYAGKRCLGAIRLWLPGAAGWLFWPLWLLLPTALIAVSFLPRGRWKGICRRAGELWLTLVLYPFSLIALAEIASAVAVRLGRPLPSRGLALSVLAGSAVLLLLSVPGALYPQIVRYRVSLPGLEEDLKAVVVSDFHLGFFTPRSLPERLAKTVWREAPDLLLIPGDIFDEEFTALRHPGSAEKALLSMAGRLGTFACEGNHDNYAPSPRAEEFCRQAGIRILRDEWENAGPLRLGGRLDQHRRVRLGAEEFLSLAGDRRPRVVLDHGPAEGERLLKAGADLVLSGHTHGGQTFPGNLLGRLLPYPVRGWRDHPDGCQIVTSGVGIWGFPLRLGVRSEIVVLELRGV